MSRFLSWMAARLFQQPVNALVALSSDAPERVKMIAENDPSQIRLAKFKSVQMDLEETVSTMHLAIKKTFDRGVSLDAVIEETELLEASSRGLFMKSLPWHRRLMEALRVRWEDCCRTCRACCCCQWARRAQACCRGNSDVPSDKTEKKDVLSLDPHAGAAPSVSQSGVHLRRPVQHGDDVAEYYASQLDI